MSSAAAIATYTGRYFPQDAQDRTGRVRTPPMHPSPRTIVVKPPQKEGKQ